MVEIIKELEATFGRVQIEWVRVPGGVEVLQMNLISPPRDMIRKEGKPEHHLKIGSLRELPRLQVFLENHPYGLVSLELGEIINLNSFQGELIAIIAVYGNRISSISTTQTVLPSSHLANNCRTFGIELISR